MCLRHTFFVSIQYNRIKIILNFGTEIEFPLSEPKKMMIMRTIKTIVATLFFSVAISSCSVIIEDDTHYIPLEQVVNAYDLWYIDYNRTENSDMWSSLFGFVPLANIEIISNPVIKIKIKSNTSTQVTLKPYFGDESNEVSDWLQYNTFCIGSFKLFYINAN